MSKIIYALIAKGTKPLTAYSEFQGNFQMICLKVLGQIQPDSTANQKVENYMIYVHNQNSISYLLMADANFPKEGALNTLMKMKKQFTKDYPGRDFYSEPNYGLDESFKDKLQMIIQGSNDNPTDSGDEVINNLTKTLSLEQKHLLEASSLLDERGAKLTVIVQKSEELQASSVNYYKGAVRVRKFEQCKRIKLYIGIAVALAIVAWLISSFICRFDYSKCRKA